MKFKKLFLSILCAILVLPCFFMVGCNDTKTESRMTVDLNPSVEFMLDKDNKVVSVTALNDDGSVIIYGETFIGLTAEEAAQRFADIAKQTGYLQVGASATENEIKISITGNEDLFNSVKNKVNNYLTENNLAGKITEIDALTKEQLATLVSKTSVQETLDELKQKSEQELLKLLSEEREDAKDLISPALQEAYYNAKAYKVNLAENETIKNALNAVNAEAANKFSQAITGLTEAENLLSTIETSLADPNGEYQQKVKALLDKKQELINKEIELNNTTNLIDKAQLEVEITTLEAGLLAAENALTTLKGVIDLSISTMRNTLSTIKSTINTQMTEFSSILENIKTNKLTEIQNAINTAKDQAFAAFETEYETQIESYNTFIENLKNDLKAKVENPTA